MTTTARRPDALAAVMPHRANTVWECRTWQFVCLVCTRVSACGYPTPAEAAELARLHLGLAHPFHSSAHVAASRHARAVNKRSTS